MKAIIIGTYYQILNFLRVKKALFFTCIFPIFLYVLFTFVWGNNSEKYSSFIVSGIIGITVVSNSLMAISKIILCYNTTGMAKILKSIPTAYTTQIIALIFSRFIVISISFLVLLIFALIFSSFVPTISYILHIELGILLGMGLFTFLGIVLGEMLEDKHSESTFTNGIFYAIMFLSNAFYPLSEMNPALKIATYINPITPILNIMRNEGQWIFSLVGWFGILIIGYIYYSKHYNNIR